MHDDLSIYGFSLGLIAGSSKSVNFLKFSVLREALVLVEFILLEFLLSCYFSKFVRFQNGKTSKSVTILIIVKFFSMESLVYFEILTAWNAWVLWDIRASIILLF